MFQQIKFDNEYIDQLEQRAMAAARRKDYREADRLQNVINTLNEQTAEETAQRVRAQRMAVQS